MKANDRQLSVEEQKQLYILLAEAKARGINLDKYARKPVRTKNKWNIDDRGYFIKSDGTFYKPTITHKAFLESKALFVRLKSGRGGGKTAAGAQKALKRVMLGNSGTIINPDFENFKISTWPELREWIPWHMVVPQHRYRRNIYWEASRPFMIAFLNNAKIYCKGLKNPSSARGANVNWLWYDEGGRDETGEGWQIAVASVRIGEDTQRWATYTPRTPEHWTYKFFDLQLIPQEVYDILKALGYDETIKIIDAFQMSSQENKDNLNPFFYASLVTTYPSGYLRTQELEGLEASEDTTLGSRTWFDGKGLDKAPEWAWKRLRYWDLAASEKKVKKNRTKTDPDSTVGTLLSVNKEKDKFCIENQVFGQWKWENIKENIKDTGLKDGVDVGIWVEEEPGSGGINQVAEIIDYCKQFGLTVHPHNPRNQGDKVMRANTWFGEAAQGQFYYVKGLWSESFFQQLDSFPVGQHDDKIDSISGARHVLAPIRTWRKSEFIAVGLQQEQQTAVAEQ